METFETGPEFKRRLIFEAAVRGEFGLKLCERHYFAHVEGSPECIMQSARQFNEFFGIFDESSLRRVILREGE